MRLHIFSGHLYVFCGLAVYVPCPFFPLSSVLLMYKISFNRNLISFPILQPCFISMFNFNLVLKILVYIFNMVKSIDFFFLIILSSSLREQILTFYFLKRPYVFTVNSLTHLELIVVYNALICFLM